MHGDEWDKEITSKDITLTDIESDEIPSKWLNLEDVEQFMEAYFACDQDAEVVEAALECGIEGRNIDEAYQGEYKDDEDFAQDFAEQLGAIDRNASWPMNCIDWKQAAKDLMMDYSEHNGYYFRIL